MRRPPPGFVRSDSRTSIVIGFAARNCAASSNVWKPSPSLPLPSPSGSGPVTPEFHQSTSGSSVPSAEAAARAMPSWLPASSRSTRSYGALAFNPSTIARSVSPGTNRDAGWPRSSMRRITGRASGVEVGIAARAAIGAARKQRGTSEAVIMVPRWFLAGLPVRPRRGQRTERGFYPSPSKRAMGPMNLLLLQEDDFATAADRSACDAGRSVAVEIRGDRVPHLRDVHGARIGRVLKVGRLGGRIGRGVVVAIDATSARLEVVLDADPPAKLPFTLLLALPRPKTLRRVVQSAATL